MNIVFRVDSSVIIGTGHVMRCLTLADMLKEKGANCIFLCRSSEGNMIDAIKSKGHLVIAMPPNFINQQEDAAETAAILENYSLPIAWLIVDHYKLDRDWEKEIKPYVERIMVVDDLANRKHDCSLLVDQNYFIDFEYRYEELVPEECVKLLGPQYLLLRPEFTKTRLQSKARDGQVSRILVFYGGSDPTNETVKVLNAFQNIEADNLHIDVVVGTANPNRHEIKEICDAHENFEFHCQIDYLASLMAKSDLSLGAGGVTMWERCYLGLPSIATIVAENQSVSTQAAGQYGAVWNFGWHGDVKVQDYADIIEKVLHTPEVLRQISESALQLMNSKPLSTENKVLEALLNFPK